MKNWEINPATNRTKHGQRRHQILAIAGQLVASEGLEGLKLPVIARELGIPAVVGVPGLTEIVSDAENVRMDLCC